MKITSVLAVTIGLASAASAADITGTVTLKGTPPAEVTIEKIKEDAICSKTHTEPVTTKHFVVGSKGELANVLVMLKGPNLAGKSTGASAAPVVMDQKGCVYVPQIMAIQTGQKLQVKNSDPTLHNVHSHPTASANNEQNLPQGPGAPDLNFTFAAPENFLKITCEVHPWMFAWVTVVDHPYFAVTGPDGAFKLSNVPPGKYTITAIHRKAAPTGMESEVEVKDGAVTKDFTLEVK